MGLQYEHNLVQHTQQRRRQRTAQVRAKQNQRVEDLLAHKLEIRLKEDGVSASEVMSFGATLFGADLSSINKSINKLNKNK